MLPVDPPGAGQSVVIFLIADIRGYTRFTHEHGDEAAARLTARFAELARDAVAPRGGHIVEVRGDEVLAVFPSARQALRAAVDLQARCAAAATPDLPLRAGIGLDAGEPVPLGDGYRGEALNVAARLCAVAAPGEVLAAESVVHLARRVEGLVYDERGPMLLKGLSAPVRVCAIRSASASPDAGDEAALPLPDAAASRRGVVDTPLAYPLVARDAELGRALSALDAAGEGQGRLVLIAGEPGVGKTRLAREILRHARDRGFHVLAGRCYEQHMSIPFFPFVELLAAALALAPPALRADAPRRYPELARLLPDVLGSPPAAGGDDARLRVLRAVSGFLQALSLDAPVALLIDDLHWADSASLELLHHMARQIHGQRLLLVGTYRDVDVHRQHPLERALADLLRERLAELVLLRGLPVEGTAALIAAHFGVAAVSDELASLVHTRTEGNPFFTEEVLKVLVEQGAIYRGAERWQRKDLDEIEVPFSVRSVVGQRVGRLSPEAQDLLHVAAVLGQEWDLEMLIAAAGQPEDAVLDHLDAALAARLLEARRSTRRERYAFTHALIRQTLYEEVPAHRLRRLHLRAGSALERLWGLEGFDPAGNEEPRCKIVPGRQCEQTGIVWADLARHFLAGGDEARAIRYALLAGDHAAALYAHAEAARHYQTACELLEEAGSTRRLAEARRKLGGVLFNLNRPTEALAAYQDALAAYERLDDAPGQARIHREIAWVHQWRFDLSAAAPHLERALALWPADREDRDLALLLLDAARARSFAADFTAAESLAARGLGLAERLGNPALQARALIETYLVQERQGAALSALVAVLDRAEELARRAGDRVVLARIYQNRSGMKLAMGDPRGCLADIRRMLQVAEEANLPAAQATGYRMLADIAMDAGDWREAREMALRAWSLDPQDQYNPLPFLDGDFAAGERLMREALVEARRKGDMQSIIGLLASLADIALQLGRTEEAEAQAREAADLVRQVHFWGQQGKVFSVLVEAAACAGVPDAGALLAEAEAFVEQRGHTLRRPALLRARGLLLERERNLEGARRALERSAESARALGAAIELGRTLAVLARVARALGDQQTAAAAARERDALVERLGPVARVLAWAATTSEEEAAR